MKITWRVMEKPTGRYRSFQKRGWPHAYYEDGSPAALIECGDDYVPSLVREGKHKPLTLLVARHRDGTFKWLKVKKQYATLDEAKAATVVVLAKHPELAP